jgi:hypothetical protein
MPSHTPKVEEKHTMPKVNTTTSNATPKAATYVPRPLHGKQAIADYLGVSCETVDRWRHRFKGQGEAYLCFPAFRIPTGVGRGFKLWSHTDAILAWMSRWAELEVTSLKPYRPNDVRRKARQRTIVYKAHLNVMQKRSI